MFKTILLLLISINIAILAHQQHVHQYLSKEGYYYLKSYLNSDIPEMLAHLDNGSVGTSWTNGTITAGAWLEDEYDPVYGYDQFSPGDAWHVLRSITHFWVADKGDDTENKFDVSWSFFTGRIGPYPNSYTKIKKYAYGGYILYFNSTILPYLVVTMPNGNKLRLIPNTPEDVALYYYNLSDLYKNKRMHTILLGSYKMYNETKHRYEYYDGDVYISTEFRNDLVWEILGRMAHLIQDLSVPAHAHGDEHGIQHDQYEDWVAGNGEYNYWNHQNIGGSFLNPYVSSNPLHYLMYTTQQIADHFGSSGPYEGVGNNNISGDPLPEEIVFLNNIGLSNLGAPTYMA